MEPIVKNLSFFFRGCFLIFNILYTLRDEGYISKPSQLQKQCCMWKSKCIFSDFTENNKKKKFCTFIKTYRKCNQTTSWFLSSSSQKSVGLVLFFFSQCPLKNTTISKDQLNHWSLSFDIWWKMTAANLTQRCRCQFQNFVLSWKECIWNKSRTGILCRLICNSFANSLGVYLVLSFFDRHFP